MKKELLKFISGQMSDGCGEGNFDYLNENEDKYNVTFWKYNDWKYGIWENDFYSVNS